jgi:RNA polymerase sigma factor (sigma-70 family)
VHAVELDDLIDAARAGDRQALEGLGRWLSRELMSFFTGYFKDDDINDMVQQTIVDVLEKLHKYEDRGPDSFRRWVRSFAVFEAKTKTREPHRKRAREKKIRELPVEPVLSPDSLIYGEELEEHVERCLAQLPAHQREALEHQWAGGTDEELAARVRVSVKTISSRRRRAREKLEVLLAAALATPTPRQSPSTSSSPSIGS